MKAVSAVCVVAGELFISAVCVTSAQGELSLLSVSFSNRNSYLISMWIKGLLAHYSCIV